MNPSEGNVITSCAHCLSNCEIYPYLIRVTHLFTSNMHKHGKKTASPQTWVTQIQVMCSAVWSLALKLRYALVLTVKDDCSKCISTQTNKGNTAVTWRMLIFATPNPFVLAKKTCLNQRKYWNEYTSIMQSLTVRWCVSVYEKRERERKREGERKQTDRQEKFRNFNYIFQCLEYIS